MPAQLPTNEDERLDALRALQILDTHPEEPFDAACRTAAVFDAVFSDVVMPGMSGVELGQVIRRLYPDMPVVLTSGYSHVLAEEGRHGFELVRKPYAVEELSRTLRRVTGRGRPQPV